MPRTPRSFAGTPPSSDQDYDVLAESLRAMRLTGSVFLNACFSAPFGVISPKRYDAGTPLARLQHVSVFHLIVEGGCTLEIATGEQRRIAAGDVLLLPFADDHRFWEGRNPEMAFGPDIMRPGPLKGLWTVEHGGGGAATRMVCGFIESAEFVSSPVFRGLPPLVVERTGDQEVGAVITATVREIIALADRAAPGTELMLGGLMEILFIEVLRRYAETLPASAKGWFAALNDRLVGRALQAIHKDPAHRWTVEVLARAVGASRTVLTERFHEVLGRTPIEYVTGWRMQLASERLRIGSESIAAIAAGVGYESEAAFNRAFKRVIGATPGSLRETRVAAR